LGHQLLFLPLFFPFQLTRFLDVLRLAAALADLLLHCAIVGRQAGYPRLLLVLDFLPHGLPVLQSTQPLPLFWLNHSLRPPLVLLFFGTFLTPVFGTNLPTLDKSTRPIRRRPRATFAGVACFYFFVTSISLGFLFRHQFLPL
jgi:hypothetical protein